MRWIKRLVTLLFLCSVVAAIGYFVIMPKVVPLSYQEEVEQYAKQYGVAPSLVYAVIFCESRFSPEAVSHAGAKGLMQIQDDTAYWVAEQIPEMDVESMDIFDAKTNIHIGCYYLGWLLDKFQGVEPTSLAGYNAGHNAVAKWLQDEEKSRDGVTLDEIPYEETETYVKKVMFMQKVYEYRYGV